MKIIGMGHYSRTGKSTLAEYIRSACKRRKITVEISPFAWKLKDIAYQLYGWAGMQPPEFYESATGAKARDVKLEAIGLTPVEVWCKVGEALRNEVYTDTWLDYNMRTHRTCEVLLIPDVRYANETDAIKLAGGKLIKVECVGIKPRDTVADQALVNYTGWDAIVKAKKGDTDVLLKYARRIAKWLDTSEGEFPQA
jgi:hypothetical protein